MCNYDTDSFFSMMSCFLYETCPYSPLTFCVRKNSVSQNPPSRICLPATNQCVFALFIRWKFPLRISLRLICASNSSPRKGRLTVRSRYNRTLSNLFLHLAPGK